MERNELIDEILKAVLEELAKKRDFGEAMDLKRKSRILVVTKYEDCGCEALRQCGNNMFDFSYEHDQLCEPCSYSEIIVKQLDTESLSRLKEGMLLNGYLRLINKCILLGLPITVISDDLDTVKYKNTAPPKYIKAMEKKLYTLKEWGISIKSKDEVLKRHFPSLDLCSVAIDKRVITKSDIESIYRKGIREVSVRYNAIISDIAKEYITKNSISLFFDRKGHKNEAWKS